MKAFPSQKMTFNTDKLFTSAALLQTNVCSCFKEDFDPQQGDAPEIP